MTRDTHRAAVYAAEDQLARALDRSSPRLDFFGSILTLPPERRFADLASIQRYADLVLDSLDRLDVPPVTVRTRRGTARATYEPATRTIAIPVADRRRWALRETVVLHELAHHLVTDDPSASDEPPHGPAFCGTLLGLLERVMSPEVALVLRGAYASAGVPVREVANGARARR